MAAARPIAAGAKAKHGDADFLQALQRPPHAAARNAQGARQIRAGAKLLVAQQAQGAKGERSG